MHRPEEMVRVLRGGWLHPGDLGLLTNDGSLRVLDRRSDLIVSGGENIYPTEVERVLAAHPAVAEVGVAGVPDPAFGPRPAAWIIPQAGMWTTPEELRAFCRGRLGDYKIPREVHFAPSLPRTHSGKLLRDRLARLSANRRLSPLPRTH